MRKAQTRGFAQNSLAVGLVGLLALAFPLLAQSQQDQTSQQPSTSQPTTQQHAGRPQPGQVQQPGAPPQALQIPDTQSAPPFSVRDKFEYRVIQSFGLRGFVGSFISAAVGQGLDSPHEWGEGVGGFAERYGSAFAGNLSRQTFAFVLESAFREDPRYFPSEDKSMKQRALNALKQVIVCKQDDGAASFAYARVFSDFGAGQFVNVWQPRSTGSVGEGFKRGFIGLGADAAYNFMQEFIPFTRPISLRHRH
ncbi:MAG TPA: hypothetical protein VHU83_08030 [Bryobacteraceae bacterium]|jgi:hypothetical protein|nr:hypothetical protein [Bryobacteraceae bacterium]